MFVFVLLVLVFILLSILLLFLNGRNNENYWKKRGVMFWEKHKTFGVYREYLFGQRPLFGIFQDLYQNYPDEPAVAFGSATTKSIFLRDITNIHHVTTSDFEAFSDRGLTYREEDVLANNITMVRGPKWKLLRQALSPLYTPAKLKKMHFIIDKCAREFIHVLKTNPERQKGGANDTMSMFCCAALTAAVFGSTTESIFDSPFIEIVRKALAATTWSNLKFCLSGVSCRLFKLLGLTMFPVPEKFFVDTINQVIQERKNEIEPKRHDFIELAVSLQNNGPIFDSASDFILEPTDEVLAAQASFFYMAGLGPSTIALFSTLFEIGRHPEIQNKIQEEIGKAFDKCGEELSYDAVIEMKYLEKVVKETLRMHPPVIFLIRRCVKDSILPVGNIKIEKGTVVYAPIYSLHHDPNYFPEPTVFDPDRFSNQQDFNEFYIPFGEGYRTCLGQRYVHTLIMTAVAHVLRHFTVQSVLKKEEVKYRKEFMFLQFDDIDFIMTLKIIS